MLTNLILSTDIATLDTAWTTVVKDWIGPIIYIVIGAFSLKFLFSREWSKFISFLALGVMVAVIVMTSDKIFGQNSTLVTKVGNVAKDVN